MGGLAEYCVTPASSVAALLPGVPYAESATLGCAVFTAYGALHNSAGLQRGESLVIVGAGGIGAHHALLIPHCTH
jgi:D-arabinose 1-dehydrogenase-like Zn-dependent alcohol dehydrogenase